MAEAVDKEMCDIKMCTLKDILINQESKFENHENRIKSLEDYNIQAKVDSAILKQNQAEQKSLTLELDHKQREKTDREFAKIDKQFEKTEISTEKKFEKMADSQKGQYDSQNVLLLKLIEGQNITKSNKLEITKGRMVFIVAVIGLVEILIQKFL